jgi:prepilin-type N-terminal cleavage/methylation domain-containing protein
MDVYFNIDPGKGPIYGWYLEDNEAVRPMFDAWLAPVKDFGAVRNVAQGIGNTDHLSFIAAGVPGFNPIQDYVDYDVRLHHTNADTFERVNEQDLKQNAVVLAAFYHAATRTEMIPQRCGSDETTYELPKDAGFTLIELLIAMTIAIIAALRRHGCCERG